MGKGAHNPKRLVLGASVLLFSFLQAGACGLSLEKPHAHFDGTDEQGHVLYADSLGSLDLGEGLKFPIFAIFNSSWQSSSPYLGQGWMLPLLESKIIQIDDNTFQLWQPDGWYQFMGRDSKTPSILNGQGGWKAEISGDNTITAWAPCGWKLTYGSGKITSIVTPKNQVLEIVYKEGKVAEVDLNGAPILSVNFNPETGIASGLVVNGKQINLQEGNKPLIQVVAGKNVVSQVTPSLSKVTFPDGTNKNYKFTVTDKLEPLLIADNRTIQWDPITQLTTKDGDWTYSIKADAEGPGQPDITRTNAQGQSEFYSLNNSTGVEIQVGLDGSKEVTHRFAGNSPLVGLLRERTITGNGKNYDHKFSYDQFGRLIRDSDITSKTAMSYLYNPDGKLGACSSNGHSVLKNDYLNGQLVKRTWGTSTTTYDYSNNEVTSSSVSMEGVKTVKRLNSEGKLLSISLIKN